MTWPSTAVIVRRWPSTDKTGQFPAPAPSPLTRGSSLVGENCNFNLCCFVSFCVKVPFPLISDKYKKKEE